MGLPTISVDFTTLAQSVIVRSSRGILAVIIQDDTSASWTSKSYARVSELEADAAYFTEDNYEILERAFTAGPKAVLVIRIATTDDLDDATAILANLTCQWVCTPVSSFQSDLATYVVSANAASNFRKIKALVYGVSGKNDKHIVSVPNASVTLDDDSETVVPMYEYLPRLGGLLAACPIDESVTYVALTDLLACAEVSDVDDSIDDGYLTLYYEDEAVRIARGVTTLVTPGASENSDMKKIAIVEAMDMIQEDIIRVWKNNYMGQVKNSADNQALFVAEILSYLKDLSAQYVLDPDSEISVEIDVDAMRDAWEAYGTDVSDLTDAQVKRKTYKSYVYVVGTFRILDAMEDLVMEITLQ